MLYACIVHDAVHSSRSHQDLLWFLSIGSTSRKNTVCFLLELCPPNINPYKGIIENQEIKTVGRSLRDACLGKQKSLHSQWLMKANWFFVKLVMEWWMLTFYLDSFFSSDFWGFRTHIVATTVCMTVGLHTHLRTSHIFMRVHIHAWLKVPKRFFCISVAHLHLAFSLLMIQISLLFLNGHFETQLKKSWLVR